MSDLSKRIQYEAAIASRPGQHDRLLAIAAEVEAIASAIESLHYDAPAAKTAQATAARIARGVQ